MGMKEIIDWEKYGFEPIEVAFSGQEALEKAQSTSYHLIITDIKMPGMDGLELIRNLKKTDSPAKYIVFSGYQDFEYAALAINFGVKNYILKPIDEDILIDTVSSIKTEIDKELAEQSSLIKFRDIAIEKVLYSFLHNKGGDTEINDFIFSAGINAYNNPAKLVVFLPHACNGSKKLDDIDALMKDTLEAKYPYFTFHIDRTYSIIGSLIYNALDTADLLVRLNTLLELLNSEAGISYSVMLSSDIDNAESALNSITSTFIKCNSLTIHNQSMQRVVHCNSLFGSDTTIDQVISYVNEHFCEDINLKMISSQFYMNSAYLGRLFKQYTGVGYNDYINKLRIEKAIVYLNNKNYKVSEIYKQVGYKDIVYFYKKFKEAKGVSPSFYRSDAKKQ
ncbi:two-component system response regulator YesN [Paenibacillus eucommiae]|uniref:Two-component system response regulator YesN n=2 Tax=Paenibacillus eucommiae TaxID=1355755 RepID=A0ABS4J8A4_9BACL|nr:two-component system response regulator YesN [Paenibacillus eucommiae]